MHLSATNSRNSRIPLAPVSSKQQKAKSTASGLSNGTKSLIADMMKDAKLTKFQQKQLSESLERGQLPETVLPTSSAHIPDSVVYEQQRQEREMFGKKNYSLPKRKTLGQIVQEGAYEPDTHYRPAPPKFDRDLERHKLATIFQFNGDAPKELLDPRKYKPKPKAPPPKVDRFAELMQEIEERREFLEEMRSLGSLTRDMENQLQFEMEQKLTEMKALDRKLSSQRENTS